MNGERPYTPEELDDLNSRGLWKFRPANGKRALRLMEQEGMGLLEALARSGPYEDEDDNPWEEDLDAEPEPA
jgi:hypothetical protein